MSGKGTRPGFGAVDHSPRRGVQTYKEVYGEREGPADGLRLRDVFEQLGDEIREARAAALQDKKPDVLMLKECTVELGLTWEAKGSGGVEFWVFKLGGEVTRSNTQTITLALEPLGPIHMGITHTLEDLENSVELRPLEPGDE